MKILIVFMRSIHTVRWVSQLKDSGHEVYYFDILNGGYITEWDWVTQHTNWRYKFGGFKGRYFIKKNFPKLHRLFENSVEKTFKDLLHRVQPDLVHSIVMHKCTVPIYSVMLDNTHIYWAYTSWGSDLYYHNGLGQYRKDIIKVLPHINYIFADCNRDIRIAKELGFTGKVLGVFPGGGGYDIQKYDVFVKPLIKRKTILIKGYETLFGKAINVVRAIKNIKIYIPDIEVIVFGADSAFIKSFENLKNVDFFEVKT